MARSSQSGEAPMAALACCAGVAERIVQFWRAKGVEDAVDLAGLYKSEAHLRAAVSYYRV